MQKRFELAWLNDFYGPLLTENRRNVVRLYLEEDLTLQEIAEQLGISRQGVHDALRAAEAQLQGYEEKLGLLKRTREAQQAFAELVALLGQVRAQGEDGARLQRAIDLIEAMRGEEKDGEVSI